MADKRRIKEELRSISEEIKRDVGAYRRAPYLRLIELLEQIVDSIPNKPGRPRKP